MNSVSLEAPAKINLGLRITGIRPDGFHSIESVFSSVTLCDHLTVSLCSNDSGVSLICSGIPSPADRTNLAFKAASMFIDESGYRGGISISLHKNIPSPGGLGGGSSDAAAVLLALRELTDSSLNLSRMGERLGSDVPFFLLAGKSAFAAGRGEILTPVEIPEFHCVLVHSGDNIPTPLAFELWDKYGGGLTETRSQGHYTALNFGVWHEGKTFPVRLNNHFLPILLERFPGVARTALEISSLSDSWGLSGSGPSFYALFRSETEAMEAEKQLFGKFPWVFRCQSR